jgi:hypothetical protein
VKVAQIDVVDNREEEDEAKSDLKKEEKDEPPAYEDMMALIKKVRRLKVEQRDTFMDALAEQDFA